ncbi:MAG: hypothetical protein KF778_03990 [Rhodocyclaceae bacterium]|nr:hypothetical protein [Rhodocyclaceae bacterium]
MGAQRHTVLRQTLELALADGASAWPLQQQAQAVQAELLRELEQCCDQLSAPDRLHRITRLELDLGALAQNDFAADFLGKLKPALREGLAQAIARLENASGPAPQVQSQWELLSQYLRLGRLPWWADTGQAGQPQAALALLMQAAAEGLRRDLSPLLAHPPVLTRLAGHFDDTLLTRLLAVLLPQLASVPAALAGILIQTDQPLPEPSPAENWRSGVWRSMFANAGAASVAAAGGLAFSRGVLLRLAGGRMRAYRHLVGQAQQSAQALGAADTAGIAQILAQLSAEQAVAESGAASRAERRAGTQQGQAVEEAPQTEPSGSDAADSASMGRSPTAGEQAALPAARAETGMGAPHRNFAEPPNTTGPDPDASPPAAEGGSVAAHRTSELDSTAAASADLIRRMHQQRSAPPELGDTDAIPVSNAGLVILWPHFKLFLQRLDLLEGKQFKNAAAQARAAVLLHCVATGEPAAPEYLLPLNKLLCGLPLDAPCELEPALTDTEIDECEGLLAAVIAQLPILNNMSVAGFRASFLLRAGMLDMQDGTWLLRVERETHDLVLEQFPWGFQWVKLPWMEAPLQVEW